MAAKSESRLWIDELPPRSLFEPGDVPGSKATVQSMLSRMASDPQASGVERVHHGLYFKREDFWWIDANENDVIRAAFRIAGPGAGMTNFTALNRLFWVWQVPNATYLITAADTLPSTPLLDGVRWELIPDAEHRMELSGAECSLLEAARWTVWVEREWDDLLKEIMTKPQCPFWRTLNSIGGDLRPDALREVAALEKPTHLEAKLLDSCGPSHGVPLKSRIENVAAAIETRYKADREGWVLI
ncbi:MAG: hypothetical protein OXD37_00510 [Acidimicrobiaceae bacterium]|nr:hypothetical protein [Acidimicrobiaceae bacterium]